jgi:DNA-binding GntR family transcriptional regulator
MVGSGEERDALARTIQDRVYQLIQQRILASDAGYRPGDKIQISRVAEELGISATPLKQALARLARDGLVEIRPRRGTYVKTISHQDLFGVVRVLRGLEMLSIDMCEDSFPPHLLRRMARCVADAERSLAANLPWDFAEFDKEFHMSVARACGNKWLVETYEGLYRQVEVRLVLYSRDRENVRASVEAHKGVVSLLQVFDKTQVKVALSKHADDAQERLCKSDPFSVPPVQREPSVSDGPRGLRPLAARSVTD